MSAFVARAKNSCGLMIRPKESYVIKDTPACGTKAGSAEYIVMHIKQEADGLYAWVRSADDDPKGPYAIIPFKIDLLAKPATPSQKPIAAHFTDPAHYTQNLYKA